MKNWVKELRRMLGDSVVLMIVGNKIDLEKNRRIEKSVAIEYVCIIHFIYHRILFRYANSVGAGYRETSAKENVGIDELFIELTKSF